MLRGTNLVPFGESCHRTQYGSGYRTDRQQCRCPLGYWFYRCIQGRNDQRTTASEYRNLWYLMISRAECTKI